MIHSKPEVRGHANLMAQLISNILIKSAFDKSNNFLQPHGAEYPCKRDGKYGAEEEDEERNATCSLQR